MKKSGVFRKKKPWVPSNPFLKDFTASGFYAEKRPFMGKKGV